MAVTYLQPYKTHWINNTWDRKTAVTCTASIQFCLGRGVWSTISDFFKNLIKIDMDCSGTFVIWMSSRSSLDFKMVPLIELEMKIFITQKCALEIKCKLIRNAPCASDVYNLKKSGCFRFLPVPLSIYIRRLKELIVKNSWQ